MASRVNNFVRRVYEAARRIGLREPQARLAASQAALETGYGKSVKGNNYFGIKAGSSWGGDTQNFRTWEEVGGRRVNTTAKFRKYDSMEDSLVDWASTMASRWPEAMSATTFDDAKKGLRYGKPGGYATDSAYGNKLSYIERRIGDAFDPFNGGTADFVKRTEADAGLANLMAGQPGTPQAPGIFDMYQALNDMNVTAAPTPNSKPENPANPTYSDNAVGPMAQRDTGQAIPRTVEELLSGAPQGSFLPGGPAEGLFASEPAVRARAIGQAMPASPQNAEVSVDLSGLFGPQATDFSAVQPTQARGLDLAQGVDDGPVGVVSGPPRRVGQRPSAMPAPQVAARDFNDTFSLFDSQDVSIAATDAKLPDVPGVLYADAPKPAPIQPQTVAPELPPLSPPVSVAQRTVATPQATQDVRTVTGAVPDVAETVSKYGLDPNPEGAAYGFSPWGSGIAKVYDNAPENVKIAASGPGLFGAFNDQFGTNIGLSPGKMAAPLAATLGIGAALAGLGPAGLAIPAANALGGSNWLVNRMDIVPQQQRQQPQQQRGGLFSGIGNVLSGLFSRDSMAPQAPKPQAQPSNNYGGGNDYSISFNGPIGRNAQRSENLSQATRDAINEATRGLY